MRKQNETPSCVRGGHYNDARIDSIRIYASGWNYQSMVSEAYLVAE